MKLVLHIGLPKTGTTFLQTTLLGNQKLLAAAGVCYPETWRDKIGNHYAWEDALAKDPQRAAAALRAEAERAGAGRILLSAESFVLFFGLEPRGEVALRVLAESFALELVLVLRRQDDFLESYYAQSMRAGASESIERFAEQPIFDFLALVERLRAAHPALRLRVAPFAPSREDPMASLEPICAAIGIDRTALAEPAGVRANIRTGRRMTLFLSQLDKSAIEGMGRVLRMLEEAAPIADDGGRCLSSSSFRRSFWERFADGNRRLCAIIDDPALTASLCQWRDPEPDWAAPAPITDEERLQAMKIVEKVDRRRRALLRAKNLASSVLRPFTSPTRKRAPGRAPADGEAARLEAGARERSETRRPTRRH